MTDETLEGNGPISHIPPHSAIKVDYDFETGEQTVELVETDIAITEFPEEAEKAIISEISPG